MKKYVLLGVTFVLLSVASLFFSVGNAVVPVTGLFSYVGESPESSYTESENIIEGPLVQEEPNIEPPFFDEVVFDDPSFEEHPLFELNETNFSMRFF